MIDRMQIPYLSMTDMFREISEQLGGKIIDHEGRYITYASPSFLYTIIFPKGFRAESALSKSLPRKTLQNYLPKMALRHSSAKPA